VDDPVSGLAATSTALNGLKSQVTTLDGKVTSTSEKTDGVYAQVNPKMAGDEKTSYAGDDVSLAGAWSVMSAIAEGDLAQAMKTDALEVRVNQNQASITNVDTASASRDEALAQRVTRLDARVNQNQASITNVDTASASRDEALAQRVTRLDAQVKDNSASIETKLTTLATADKTLAQSIDTVQTKVNQQSASIQTNATAIADTNGKLAANWSVRMQVAAGGGYTFAGIGLGIENGPGGLQSQFIISADRFAVGQKDAFPFLIQDGQTIIANAFIGNGTITNAKIGDYIQSNNYSAGTTGWKLFFDGTFEINGNVPGQGRSMMTHRSLRIWDGGGIKRVQLGDLTE